MKKTFQPIDLEIDDKRKYSLIAFLVDRDDFLIDIEKIRKQIGISNIPYVFPKLSFSEANSIVEFYKKGQFTINDLREEFQELHFEKKLPYISQIDRILGRAIISAQILLKTYKKSKLYFPVMLASILVGKITTYDFSSTYMLKWNFKDVLQELDVIQAENDPPMAIIVNRESKQTEVLDVFKNIQKYYFGTKKLPENDPLINIYKDKIPQSKLTDTNSSIEDVRKWYWWNKNEGLGAKRILDRLGGNKAITQKGIEQALNRYKKNLQKPL